MAMTTSNSISVNPVDDFFTVGFRISLSAFDVRFFTRQFLRELPHCRTAVPKSSHPIQTRFAPKNPPLQPMVQPLGPLCQPANIGPMKIVSMSYGTMELPRSAER